jgi:hypothetical protein
MPNINAKADTFSCPNYLGELFQVGQKETPFLNMIGGLTGGGKQVTSFLFPVTQEWGLNAAAQPAISEDDAATAPAPTTYVRSQKYNTVQIFHRAVTVTYAKQSSVGALSGINIEGGNPVRDEKAFQIEGNLKQVARDVEHTFINGVYQEASASNVAAKTRGMLEAIQTNEVDAGGATLTLAMLKDLVRSMADNGAPFDRPVLFAGSRKIQEISDLYKADDKFTSHERNIGGVAVKTVLTDFVELGVVWAPAMPQDAVLIADMSYIAPVFLAVPKKGFLFYEELSKKGAAEEGQIYGQIGLDYGPEAAHGKIANLA